MFIFGTHEENLNFVKKPLLFGDTVTELRTECSRTDSYARKTFFQVTKYIQFVI